MAHGGVNSRIVHVHVQGPSDWLGKYYKYRLRVFSPWSRTVETLETTDPYSRSVAADGARTQACAPT